MKNWLLIPLLFQFIAVNAQQTYWQQQVNYRIQVKLNDNENTLDGFMEMEYINQSPDTLYYIWMHLWLNAYRTDRTAFSDQLLENGRTDFYFSNKEQRGYIHRLDFRTQGKSIKTEDHPEHIDIIKLLLPEPLLPSDTVRITTPFHVKIPFNFSRGGHYGQSYQMTQWFPKAAVYDPDGWHPIPYLDQGEFYSNFGNYDVTITLPENYVVLATGDIADEDERNWLKQRSLKNVSTMLSRYQSSGKTSKEQTPRYPTPPSSAHEKTLRFCQQQVHDFAWFADKRLVVETDTIVLSDGSIKNLYAAYSPENSNVWQHALRFMKASLRYRSNLLGTYPYSHLAAVEAYMGEAGGMEYPCITSIWGVTSAHQLAATLEHEIGHNWFQGMLANNERAYPWLDEGINTYYEKRFLEAQYESIQPPKEKIKNKEDNWNQLVLQSLYNLQLDQPLASNSAAFTKLNYNLLVYEKGASFMQYLENFLGKAQLDKAMRDYFNEWKFKHPTPADFQQSLEKSTGKNLNDVFSLLQKKGNEVPTPKQVKIFPVFGMGNARTNALIISPAAGFNNYDKLMAGISLHNYTLPVTRFQFIVTPVYGTASKTLNGIAHLQYHFFPAKNFKRISLSLQAARFSTNRFTDSLQQNYFTGVQNIAPGIKFLLKEDNPRSTRERYIQWRTYFLQQDALRFRIDTVGGGRNLLVSKVTNQRYLHQLKYVTSNHRVLYPYILEWQIEQSKDFMRLAFTGNYFFNYPSGGGMQVRMFAGKFLYLGTRSITRIFETDPYHLNMTGPKGYEDYTFSNYFPGRSEFEGFFSQQIMQRDGFFKVRTDLLSDKIGKTDNWLTAINFTTDVPDVYNPLKLLPFAIPLKLFLDIGTYADAWNNSNSGSRILFDAGLQFSMLRNLVNVYVPVFYSKVYADYFKSTFPDKRFVRTISFSIDIQNLKLKKLFPQLPAGL